MTTVLLPLAAPTGEPKAKPLTPIQKAMLQERDQLRTEANQLGKAGKLTEAATLIEKMLALERAIFGDSHQEVANSLNLLARLHEARQDFKAARKAHQEVLAIRTKLYGAKDWRVTDARLALEGVGRLAKMDHESRQRLRQASVFEIKVVHLHGQGEYKEALILASKVREIRRQLLGENHLDYARILDNLAGLHSTMGDYAKALPLHEQARDLTKKLLTENHPEYATSLNNLARLYQSMGDYAKALPLYEQARDLFKKLLTENHPHYATSLNNLAALYQDMRDYAKALALYEQARNLYKNLLTERHPAYARSLNNLANLYQRMGEYAKALPLYEQARDLRKKLLTEHHPDYTTSLNNLASLYTALGHYAKAWSLFEEARELRKKLLTENHPQYATSLSNLALLYLLQGQPKEAAPLSRQALTVQQTLLDRTFGTQGERQRLLFLRKRRSPLHLYLSTAPAAQVPVSILYAHVLPWKATLALRQAEERLAHDQPALQPFLTRLHRARANLAHFSRTAPTTKEQQALWLKRFDELEAQKEELEADLARESDSFRLLKVLRKVTAPHVVQTLPPKTALIEFIAYWHIIPSPKDKGKFDREERLLAFVLLHDRAPVLVPLGSVDVIAREIQSWRQVVVKYQNPDKGGAKLRRRIWESLQKHLGDATTVLLAPDGPVSGLPFAALPGSKPGSYLIEEVTIGYVTSGRHLLELDADTSRPKSAGLLAVGGLSYGKPDPKDDKLKPQARDLPGTEVEVERLAQAYRKHFPKEREPVLLRGAAADALRLKKELTPVKEQPRWRYLHLATHGFFEPPAKYASKKRDEWGFAEERALRTFGQNPMLLSGLVLSEVNNDPGKGTLTAEEVMNLDLRGTELVVLSACETGLGKDLNLEGVMGQRRAFQGSGAKALVVSMWNISDAATSVLMEEFYTNLWGKKLGKLQALRQAQLTVLRNPQLVQQRAKELRGILLKRSVTEAELASRELGKKAVDLPGGGKVEPGGRSPLAWWAAFILSGEIREQQK
jgi:CHAT domain-containing protein/tetratricopeptide (TPR) repeat protein